MLIAGRELALTNQDKVLWDEVADVEPADFTIDTMRERVRRVGDLTQGIWDHSVSLLPLFERVGLAPPGEAPPPRTRSGPPRD